MIPKASSVLDTPGKSGRKRTEESKLGTRSPLQDLSGNCTPKASEVQYDDKYNLRRNGLLQRSIRKIRNKHRDHFNKQDSDDEDVENDLLTETSGDLLSRDKRARCKESQMHDL